VSGRLVSRQLVRFVVVGACNTILTLSVYALLLAAGLHYLVAFAPAFAAGAVVGYTLNRLWTFGAAPARRWDLVRYASIQLAGLATNAVLLIALVEEFGIGRIPAQVVAIGCVSLVSFGVSRRWVFGARVHA
jgi:putative flippase GtrA